MDRGGRGRALHARVRPRAGRQSAADGVVPEDRRGAARPRHAGGRRATHGRGQPARAPGGVTAEQDPLERAALEWIASYWNAEHLIRTRDWLVELDPDAGLALRL